MSAMQLFHRRLFGSPEVLDPIMQGLLQLTKASIADLSMLTTGLEWAGWGLTS